MAVITSGPISAALTTAAGAAATTTNGTATGKPSSKSSGANLHRHRPSHRTRSHSRSSSSPSPPPAPLIKPHAHLHTSLREKRRSFGSRQAQSQSPVPRGRTSSASERGQRERGWQLGGGSSGHSPSGRPLSGLGAGGTFGHGQGVYGYDTGNAHAGPSRLGYMSSAPIPPHNGTYPEESPISVMTDGFSTTATQYGASASSPGAGSESEGEGYAHRANYFISARGDETEVENARRRASVVRTDAGSRSGSGDGGASQKTQTREDGADIGMDGSIGNGKAIDAAGAIRLGPAPPPSTSRSGFAARRSGIFPLSQSSRRYLLPARIPLPSVLAGRFRTRPGLRLTRRRSEDALLLVAVGLGVYKLGTEWDEKAIAGEISLLIGLSIAYNALRLRSPTCPSRHSSPTVPTRPISPTDHTGLKSASPARDRFKPPATHGLHPSSHTRDDRRGAGVIDDGEPFGIGAKGCVWGTEEREYRECLDDGALFALLLGPLIASGMLHDTLRRLTSARPFLRPRKWEIEAPLVLESTPIRSGLRQVDETVKALSALATSRRNLVQLFTLCSFVLLVHLVRSLFLEVKLSRSTSPISPPVSSSSMEREGSDPYKWAGAGGTGTYWLKRGEWKRTRSAVGFACLVTACCVGVKIVTAIIGRGVWSDMSPSDIVIATLFYQFSLYVCVRLAKRGFTLGELAVVCNAATAMFMESVNLTRMKIALIRTPYIKTYRLPTPLLTFQLALIPGSLLAGFLLSPLLYLSRHLAQRPAHRLRFPNEKATHRRLLALGFYGGAVIVCAGLVGTWTRWCLGWRDPFVWIVQWLLEGEKAWTRPGLIAYWAALALVSVAGWSRQLIRARRHRRYVVPNTSSKEKGELSTALSPGLPGQGAGGVSGVATQMMDAADQRMPTLSVNARRKFFHALAVVMFVPGISVDPAFTHLSFSVAFAAFNFAEYIRYFALWPFGVSVHLFLNEFVDSKDSGTAILSHFYLLAGCAAPLWLEGPEVLSYYGVLVLGVGDALASIVGRRVGKVKWCAAGGKTLEGSVAFVGSVLVSTMFLWAFGMVRNFNPIPYSVATILTGLLEAFSAQNDNLILPMYGWAVATLLGV